MTCESAEGAFSVIIYTTSNFAKVRLKLQLPGVHRGQPEQEDGHEEVDRVEDGEPEHQVVEALHGDLLGEHEHTHQVPRQPQHAHHDLDTADVLQITYLPENGM